MPDALNGAAKRSQARGRFGTHFVKERKAV
jgi:hypothetical protein